VVHRLAHPAPARVARRQAAASAAASASCATARRRGRLLRKSHAAANDQESKVRAREIRASEAGASAGRRSIPLPPRRPNVLQRQSAVRLQALRRRDREPLPLRGRDHNRLQQPEQRREEVARLREVAAGAKSSGSRPAAIEALTPVLDRGDRIAAAERGRGVSARMRVTALRSMALRSLQWRAPCEIR
jgi:hypothetical protein